MASTALPEQTFTSGGISFKVRGHLSAAQARDGSWIIQVPWGKTAQVVHASCGGILNIRGTNEVDVHTASLALPLAVDPCDALSLAKPGSGRGAYWDVPGRSSCSEATAVVFVPYPAAPGLLRPPVIGDNWIVRFFRSQPIPESLVLPSRMPDVVDTDSLPVDWSAWGKSKPSIAYITGLLAPFSGEFYSGWSTDTRTPDWQHPGYGSYYTGAAVSPAMVWLCAKSSPQSKMLLALAVVQRGLDLLGAYADGRTTSPGNGHGQGRKALLIAAGHLLGIPEITNPTSVVGPVFQEDMAYKRKDWWFGSGWTAGWASMNTPELDGSLLSKHPSEWGDANSPKHTGYAWALNGYMGQTVGSQVGTALGMRLMRRTVEMGSNFDKMVSQWMQGPPEAAKSVLASVGINLPWGSDYSVGRGVDFCAAAWKKYENS